MFLVDAAGMCLPMPKRMGKYKYEISGRMLRTRHLYAIIKPDETLAGFSTYTKPPAPHINTWVSLAMSVLFIYRLATYASLYLPVVAWRLQNVVYLGFFFILNKFVYRLCFPRLDDKATYIRCAFVSRFLLVICVFRVFVCTANKILHLFFCFVFLVMLFAAVQPNNGRRREGTHTHALHSIPFFPVMYVATLWDQKKTKQNKIKLKVTKVFVKGTPSRFCKGKLRTLRAYTEWKC